jgi:hypothetical protein
LPIDCQGHWWATSGSKNPPSSITHRLLAADGTAAEITALFLDAAARTGWTQEHPLAVAYLMNRRSQVHGPGAMKLICVDQASVAGGRELSRQPHSFPSVPRS